MRHLKWRLLLLAPLCLALPPASEAAEPSSPEALVEEFIRAWNAHDMKAWAGLFAEDGDFVSGTGAWLKGRAEILASLEKAHATYFKPTMLAASGIVSRLPRPDVGVIRFNTELTGMVDSEGKPQLRRGLFLIVAAKQAEGWRIVAAQNTYRQPQ